MLVASPRPVLDDIAEVAGRTIRSDFAVIALQGEAGFTVIGGHGIEDRFLPVVHDGAADWSADGVIETYDLQTRPNMADYPALTGIAAPISSTLYAPIRHDGQIVGLIGTAACEPVGSYTRTERDILHRLARVTEAAIRSEVALARLAADAFRALERCRAEMGQS